MSRERGDVSALNGDETPGAVDSSVNRGYWLRRASKFIPAIQWLPGYNRRDLPGDLIAGTIVAVMLVPQGMAYAMLAGLPPEFGLYASILPLIIYGLMGTSRALGVGPVAIVALLSASSVSALAQEETSLFIALSLLLALMVGVTQLVLGLVRAGFLVNFMSHPVLSGFINAAALMIAASQIGHLLGVSLPRNHTFLEQLISLVEHLSGINYWTTGIGLGSLLVLVYFHRFARRNLIFAGVRATAATLLARTGPLIAAASTTVLVWLLNLDAEHGVAVVGSVPPGMPGLTVPEIELDHVRALLPAALIISLVGFMESISIAKSLASRERERVDANQELVALGTSNIGAALSGGFAVTGSFSRSVLNYAAGARTGLASIVTALIVLLSVLVLTPLFYYLPRAALAAIVIVAVFGLLESHTFRRAWGYRLGDAATLVITFAAVLVLGVELGLIAGIGSSIAIFLWRTSRPNIVELGRVKGTTLYRNVNRHDTEDDPRILILRIDESLYFANTQHLQDGIIAKVGEQREIAHLVLVGSSINDIDASALETLEELTLQLAASGITVHLAAFKLTILERLRGTLLMQLIGPERTHNTTAQAVAAISERNREEPGNSGNSSED